MYIFYLHYLLTKTSIEPSVNVLSSHLRACQNGVSLSEPIIGKQYPKLTRINLHLYPASEFLLSEINIMYLLQFQHYVHEDVTSSFVTQYIFF